MIKTEINNQCMRKLKGNFKISTVLYPFLVEGHRAELEELFILNNDFIVDICHQQLKEISAT